MLESLKFVRGAIGKKDLVIELTHFNIEDGRITGYNGNLALSSPIAMDLNLKPKAAPFVKAIEKCEDTVQLGLTSSGRLSIKSGKFRCYIECIEAPFPVKPPEGQLYEIPESVDLLKAFEVLYPFISEDASRPWSRGACLNPESQSIVATNNICLVEYWVGFPFPVRVNIPKPTIKEIIRIGLPIRKLQLTNSEITFHYDGDRWLKSQLYTAEWPNINNLFQDMGTQTPVHAQLFEGIENLKPFLDPEVPSIHFTPEGLSTHRDEGTGAYYALEGWGVENGRYDAHYLAPLEGIIETADWSYYPRPVPFFGLGKCLRGVIIGQRG